LVFKDISFIRTTRVIRVTTFIRIIWLCGFIRVIRIRMVDIFTRIITVFG
jgi:hypothetical protein